MRGEHRAPTESRGLLVLTLGLLMVVFAVVMIGVAVWSMATAHDAIDRLPVLQVPSPTPESWLDRLHDQEDGQ